MHKQYEHHDHFHPYYNNRRDTNPLKDYLNILQVLHQEHLFVFWLEHYFFFKVQKRQRIYEGHNDLHGNEIRSYCTTVNEWVQYKYYFYCTIVADNDKTTVPKGNEWLIRAKDKKRKVTDIRELAREYRLLTFLKKPKMNSRRMSRVHLRFLRAH